MPFIDLPAPPMAPQRTDDPEVFIERADAFVAWQEAFASALGTFIAQLETAAALIAAAPAYSDPGLAAMAGHAPAADRLIYFTGSASSSLATITAMARALLAAASTADAQTAIGISAWAQTLLDDANSAAARSTMGAAVVGANNDITSLLQSVTIAASGGISPDSLGFRGLPRLSGSSVTSLVLGDAGRAVGVGASGLTIPSNDSVSFPINTAIVLINDTGAARSIGITADTLYLAGTTLTGTRSLLPNGIATLVKRNATTWIISGTVA